ncbi:MAG TPA: hypothetical protein VNV38_10725 [Stellaceae bacterium]|jgi:hypothetical protein|nr:hypothetical protein [Stellaceae bacterium]
MTDRWTACCWQSGVAIVLIVVLTGALLWAEGGTPDVNKVLTALITVILGLFAAVVLAKMFCGPIDLKLLVSEDNGSASMSRFQFLIFTFVIAGSYLALTFAAGKFVDIPGSVLGLLGISGGSYVGSKVVQKAAETSQANAATNPAPQAPAAAPANPAPV